MLRYRYPSRRLVYAGTRVVIATAAAVVVLTMQTSGSLGGPAKDLGEQEAVTIRDVGEALAAFEAEPAGSCTSAHLRRARALVEDFRTLVRAEIERLMERKAELEARSGIIIDYAPTVFAPLGRADELLLDVADGAVRRGCPGMARELYRDVYARSVGIDGLGRRRCAAARLAALPGGAEGQDLWRGAEPGMSPADVLDLFPDAERTTSGEKFRGRRLWEKVRLSPYQIDNLGFDVQYYFDDHNNLGAVKIENSTAAESDFEDLREDFISQHGPPAEEIDISYFNSTT